MQPHPITRRACAAWLAALPAFVAARPLQGIVLAREAPAGIDPAGFLVSEKYDGVRALWDGRSLRFRSGLPVHAPAWFTDRLPALPLDGELWLGRGRFEALSGTVRRKAPDDAAWRQLRFMVFELPGGQGDFALRAARIATIARQAAWPQLEVAPQRVLIDRPSLQRLLDEVVRHGGEGLVLHRAGAPYEVGRSEAVLKLKPHQDAEAVVLGHLPGRGKHAGRMGALCVRTNDGVEFLLGTGFRDTEREGPPPVGAVVTFTHRGHHGSGCASLCEPPAPAPARRDVARGRASYSTSLAKSARRERSPRASVRWPPCGQPLKRSTA